MTEEEGKKDNQPTDNAGGPAATGDDATQQLAECQKEREEYLNGWKRAKADLINYQKDEARRLNQFLENASVDLLKDFLPVLDSFELALASTQGISFSVIASPSADGRSNPEKNTELDRHGLPRDDKRKGFQDDELRNSNSEANDHKGLSVIFGQLLEALKKRGLERIMVKPGDMFDARLHEALGEVELKADDSQTKELAGKIVEELSAGYTLNGRVIRAAKVKLGKV